MRIFTFGCSLTQYFYPTWADLVITHYEDKHDAHGTNWGRSGAGNQYIATRIWEANSIHNFNKDDIIFVQWTSMFREDRYHEDHGWSCPGGFNQKTLSGNEFRLNGFDYHSELQWADFLHCTMRDCALITSTTRALRAMDCKVITTGFRNFNEGYEKFKPFKPTTKLKYENLGAIIDTYKDELIVDVQPILNALNFGTDDSFFESRPRVIPMLGKEYEGHNLPEIHPLPMEHLEYAKNYILEHLGESIHESAVELAQEYHEKTNNKDLIVLNELGWANLEQTGFSDDGWRP